ncbi:PEP/pyruvate-binding domain-containing protein [Desulfogranum japonicum]|uniref:PEP/pyruvate-binding domain-containing protein n=1 Tax=Desulfogranum japonicum TaxID=231447 RepID=UPI000413750C|nr:PEP/pyruvate-binding domain-containing protein [Desulfogranum japonicum]
MGTFLSKLQQLFFPSAPSHSLEELQQRFLDNYSHFRELLTANNNALEAMAEMEQALLQGRNFSMAFIRAKSTVVAVNVFKMIENLRYVADGKYSALVPAYETIQREIDALLDQGPEPVDGAWVLPLDAVNRASVALSGEKMANLGEAGHVNNVSIPEGFVISSAAAQAVLQQNRLLTEINRIFQQTDSHNLEDMHRRSHDVQQLIQRCTLPDELEKEMYKHFDQLEAKYGAPLEIAVRSSALGEDLGHASFAGLYQTELNVDREQLVQAYKTVLASTYSTRAMTYRLAKGYRHEHMLMGVGCLVMIKATMSGVSYSSSPGGDSHYLDIYCSPGSARGIVEGTKETFLVQVSRTPPFTQRDSDRNNERKACPLTNAQRTLIATTVMDLERHFGAPQDVEWSIDSSGKLFILQSRPISTLFLEQDEPAQQIHTDAQPLLQDGVTACPGGGSGPVRVVRNTVDLLSFPRKAILVVEHPLPEWAPLLKRASALVATTGSAAGHLATIAREFGLPTLLAVKDALKVLNNDQIITVDASHRVIYDGCIKELCVTPATSQSSPMQGSPVEQTMKQVLHHITPLTLTDPGSPFFRSSYCTTLHDITRFCHEKSVTEMFRFGERYRYVKGAAKRLVDNMPMEWWVINLADGFSEGFNASEKYINISDIASSPMLAIWNGMHAFPWKGPPQVSFRGMGSILFQSTRNPGLDPAVRSAMIQKNYFLVSRNYCNLSVRLGYHYAMIEAYISSLRTERYVTFRFKGGAADEERRVARVALLTDLLNEFEFRVDQIGDALTARVEKRSLEFLYSRLQVLGYLSIHTRQIDMVMADSGQQQRYRDTFSRDIKEMLSHDGHRFP